MCFLARLFLLDFYNRATEGKWTCQRVMILSVEKHRSKTQCQYFNHGILHKNVEFE